MAKSIEFQNRISALLEESDYTRAEILPLIKVSSTVLTNATIYGVVPTPRTLVKIADFFDVSLAYLLGKVDSNDFVKSVKNVSFPERLVELCQEKGVSQYKVAMDCGINKCMIYRWMGHGYYPSMVDLELLSEYFGVSPDYLLGRSDFRD